MPRFPRSATAARADTTLGTGRLSLPTRIGFAYVAEGLPELLAQHPGLQVDLSLSDRVLDLVAEGFNVGLRVAPSGVLPESELVARTLVTGRMRLCVSPGWLKDNRAPTRVSDLATSPCISFSPTLGPEREATWPISDGEGAEEVRVSWPVRADSGLALSAAVLGGAGIGLLPGFLVRGFLADGRLVELLPHARTRTYRV